MPMSYRRKLVATTLSIGLCTFAFGTAALYAQDSTKPADPPKAPVAATTAAPAPSTEDPAARALLNKMAAAHKALNSYSAIMDVEIAKGTETLNYKADFAYAKPNKARVNFTDGKTGDKINVVSDGKNIFSASSRIKDKYQKREAAPTTKAIAEVLGGLSQLPVFVMLSTGDDAGKQLLPPGLKSLKQGADETIGGVPVTVVTAVLGNAPNPVFTFAIGKEDNLLRKLSIAINNPAGNASLSEQYTSVKINPALEAAQFSFTPAPGATVMTQADMAPQGQEPKFNPKLKVGAAPLPFSGTDTNGKPVSLAAYKGKVVLIDFWATWCGPCVAEMPTVVAAYNKYKAQGFDIIGVSLDQPEDGAKLAAFTKAQKMPWREIHDGKNNGVIAGSYGVSAIPFSLLIGRDGKIAAVDVHGPALEAAIKTALAKK